ncbi:MAG: serine hydrolase domain-containing protein [Candidatus Thorarchaeota archaeon]
MAKRRDALVISLPLLFLILGIFPVSSIDYQVAWVPDYWPTADWQTSSPEAQGMNSQYLTDLDEYIAEVSWGYSMVSTLIIKNGYLVHETYYDDFWDGNHTRNIFSCTKSMTSTLIGIALTDGNITSLDDALVDYFADRTIANLDSRKQQISINDLLTMSAGFEWTEWPYTSSESDYVLMTQSPDWVQFVLDKPMEFTPGEFWEYNTGVSHLLSAIVNVSTGMFTQDFAEERLFSPLGITEYQWETDTEGNANGGADLRLRPRDMAKIGFLFLNNGTWDEEQIVPASWVLTATDSHVALDDATGYGFQWWTSPLWSAFSARGYLGQLIYVFPALNLVVVFTASTNLLEDHYLLENYILPATGYFPGNDPPSPEEIAAIVAITAAAILVPVTIVSAYLLYRRRQLLTPSN